MRRGYVVALVPWSLAVPLRLARLAPVGVIAGALVAGALVSPPSFAQPAERPGSDRTTTDQLAAADFATRALRAAEQHRALLALAVERAEDPAVKRFAEAITEDLNAVTARLEEIARARAERRNQEEDQPLAEIGTVPEIPAKAIPYKRPQYQRLRALHGTAFDKQFMSGIVLGYENAIRRFETEATEGDDPASRDFAADTLPRLRERLDEARALLAAIEAKPADADPP